MNGWVSIIDTLIMVSKDVHINIKIVILVKYWCLVDMLM